MTHLLPPSLLRLFAARPPLEYAAPLVYDPNPNATPLPKDRSLISKRKSIRSPLTGVAAALELVKQEAADRGESTDDIAHESSSANMTLARVTLAEMDAEAKKAAKAEVKQRGLEEYKPHDNAEATPDAYKTLFLARLAYDVTEKDLHREFDMYGPIETIRLVRDREGKSRGYAFIAYERERDVRAAWKDAEGIKINGRKIVVDFERGRTVKDWKPTRLGGGLGGSSRKPKKAPEPSEPAPGPGFAGGGFRGAPRGGFRGRGSFAPRGSYGPPRSFAPQQRSYDNGYTSRPYNAAPPQNTSRYNNPRDRDRDYPASSYNTRPSYDDPLPPAKRGRY